ncbi:MAG: hypothetical protein SPG64_05615 [Candidatus Enteromonas sp.]|nr:hypothetical protein [Candidatus Enteromonas sp.]
MAKKHYTDRERVEIVKKFRESGLSINRYLEHALENVGKKSQSRPSSRTRRISKSDNSRHNGIRPPGPKRAF